MSGTFITFEGGEGTGKSTQIALLRGRLEVSGHTVRVLREPGGTRAGEAIRSILLDTDSEGLSDSAELLLYEAARAQLVAEVIEPAIAAGEVVLCDRFFDSTVAYQGHGRGLALEMIDQLNSIAAAGMAPDRTVLLDIEVADGLARATRGGADRLECEDMSFHERVRGGFLAIAQAEPERVRIVDATGSVEAVAERIVAVLADLPVFSDTKGL